MFIGYKKVFSPNIWTTAKPAALWKKQSVRDNIWSKIRIVGHPKWWYSRVAACFAVAGVQVRLLDIKKFFLPTYERQQSSRLCWKGNLWSIIFAVKLGLWVIQKIINSGVAACVLNRTAYFAVAHMWEEQNFFVSSKHKFIWTPEATN